MDDIQVALLAAHTALQAALPLAQSMLDGNPRDANLTDLVRNVQNALKQLEHGMIDYEFYWVVQDARQGKINKRRFKL